MGKITIETSNDDILNCYLAFLLDKSKKDAEIEPQPGVHEYGDIEEIFATRDELSELDFRVDLLQIFADELLKKTCEYPQKLRCKTAAADKQKVCEMTYNLGPSPYYEVTFIHGHISDKEEPAVLMLNIKRPQGEENTYLKGAITGLPDELEPGACALLKIKSETEDTFVFDFVCLTGHHEIDKMLQRISDLEHQVTELTEKLSVLS